MPIAHRSRRSAHCRHRVVFVGFSGVTTFVQQHDCLLLDLDGTMFRGHRPTRGALDALSRSAVRRLFITNNASRSAEGVAAHLRQLGFAAAATDVVTSAQAAARLLAQQLPPAAAVLVVGTDALADEVTAVGLRTTRVCCEDTAAVVQGHHRLTAWSDLAEAALAIRAGALWVATNVDRTLPSERGLLPGNGAMVAALRSATDREPQIAGKPSPALFDSALRRGHFEAPLLIGDRLDTDIAGANAMGIPSLAVLSGVSTALDVISAAPPHRPSYLAQDLRSLHTDIKSCSIAQHPAWHIDIDGGSVTVATAGSGGSGLALVRSLARAVWDAGLGAGQFSFRAGDDAAALALRRWALAG